jgi:hypothetical protein
MENQLNENEIAQEEKDYKPEFLSKPEEDWTTDDAVEAKKYAQKMFNIKEHWKTKATTPKEEKPKEEFNKDNDGNIDKSWQEKVELKLDGYSDDEISFIQQNGGKEALGNDFVKEAIETIRTKKKAENAVIEDENKSDIEKKYSHEQLASMPVEELEKLLPKAN